MSKYKRRKMRQRNSRRKMDLGCGGGFIRSVPLKECCGWRLLCPLETIRGTRQTKPHRSFGGNHHRIGMSRGVQTTGGRPTIVPNIISHINCVLRFTTGLLNQPIRWYHHVWKQCLRHFDIIITQFVNDRLMMRKLDNGI